MTETKEFKNIESKFKSLNSLTAESNKISKDLLNSSILQNIELSQMRTQMEAANDINKLLLKKQIEEIEKKETQKFYKALSYHCSEIVEIIQKIKDSSVQYYMIAKYCEMLKNQISEATSNLDEISGKIFNKASNEKIATLKETSEKLLVDFNNSVLVHFDKFYNEVMLLKHELSNFSLTKTLNYIPTCTTKQKIKLFRPLRWMAGGVLFFVFGIGILVIGYELYWINKTKSNANNVSLLESNKLKAQFETKEQELKLEKESKLKSEIENHAFFKTLDEISSVHPEFMKVTEEISSMLKNFNSRYQLA